MVEESEVAEVRRFSVLRLFASLTCLAVALGLIWFADHEVQRWGGGLFPALCILVAIVLAIEGIGLLFPRTGLILMKLTLWAFRFVAELLSR
jgi:hypothetical protein